MTRSRPRVIVAPSFRDMDELFDRETLRRLGNVAEIVWGRDGAMPQEDFEREIAARSCNARQFRSVSPRRQQISDVLVSKNPPAILSDD